MNRTKKSLFDNHRKKALKNLVADLTQVEFFGGLYESGLNELDDFMI